MRGIKERGMPSLKWNGSHAQAGMTKPLRAGATSQA